MILFGNDVKTRYEFWKNLDHLLVLFGVKTDDKNSKNLEISNVACSFK